MLTFSESYWQKILHPFPELIRNNTDIFKELLANTIPEFIPSSSFEISKRFFQSSYTILTLSESYYQTILTYLELI